MPSVYHTDALVEMLVDAALPLFGGRGVQTRRLIAKAPMVPKFDQPRSVEALAVIPTTFSKKQLRRVRGCRGGYYVKADRSYNSIIGINQAQYEDVLARCQLAFFGTPIDEQVRRRFGVIATDLIDQTGLKLPAIQQIKLTTQLWADMTLGEGPENHLDTHLHQNRGRYWSNHTMRTGAPDTLATRMFNSVARTLTFGLYDPVRSGLPNQ